MKKSNWVALFVTIVLFSIRVLAQTNDLGAQLSKVAGKNAENYLGPILSGWGADMNSGFYHSADLHSTLGFDIGLKVSAVLVKDEDKVFDFQLPPTITFNSVTYTAGLDYDAVVAGAPTAVGEDVGKEVKIKPGRPGAGTTIFTTPSGYKLSAVPLFMPQASIGLPFGLEVTGRFIPTISAGDAGKVGFVGFGLRHDIDQYIPFLPIDIAAHFMMQKLTFNDKNDKKLMSASSTAFGLEVSKSLVLFTLYGGFQIESSKWEFEPWDYKDPSTNVSVRISGFSYEGKNKSRFHAGIRLLLLFINIHADYSFAPNPVATAGVGISFR
jgi:hypothetical protein